MLFNSAEFLFLFLPIALFGTFAIRRVDRRASFGWLVACSLSYYGYWSPHFVVLIVASIGVNYGFAKRLTAEAGRARGLLTLGVGLNLAVLAYFKYFNFFVDNLAFLTGETYEVMRVVLPIGVSFFTFQQIALLVDSHRGLVTRLTWLDHALFVSFFPQLVAGPIVHHAEMMGQFHEPPDKARHRRGLLIGASLFSIGLFKKVWLADYMALNATRIFSFADAGGTLTSFDAWVGALSYTLQIYFDFSAYSDMAIGLGLAFGIRLPLNFDSPYQSKSIVEFWRRWHITLSRFLRDYLYIPLGGNRQGPLRRYLNLFITMLLGGLWHGAGWTFVVWGGLHGLYLTFNHAAARLVRSTGSKVAESRLYQFTGFALTMLAVVVAWVFFRAESFDGAWHVLGAMFGSGGFSIPESLMQVEPLHELWAALGVASGPSVARDMASILAIPGLLLVTWCAPNACVYALSLYDAEAAEGAVTDSKSPWPGRFALAGGVAFALALHALAAPSEFIYFQF
ncbi:MAG: MBOAT family O-acyltransferase [Myxococcota bacterium]